MFRVLLCRLVDSFANAAFTSSLPCWSTPIPLCISVLFVDASRPQVSRGVFPWAIPNAFPHQCGFPLESGFIPPCVNVSWLSSLFFGPFGTHHECGFHVETISRAHTLVLGWPYAIFFLPFPPRLSSLTRVKGTPAPSECSFRPPCVLGLKFQRRHHICARQMSLDITNLQFSA